MNSHGILVVFIVLFAKRLKLLTNTRTPYALVHIDLMAAHTAFHNEQVTRGSGCSAISTFVSLLTGIDGPEAT